MASPLFADLLERVVSAVEAGCSRRQAAQRFRVSASSAVRWQMSFAQEGQVAAKPQGGDRRSGETEAHAGLILKLYKEDPEIFLSEPCEALAEHSVQISTSSLSRFFARHAITLKKDRTRSRAGSLRRDGRARGLVRRPELDVDPDRLVFLDQMSANTTMARRYGRAPRGQRCLMAVPHGH